MIKSTATVLALLFSLVLSAQVDTIRTKLLLTEKGGYNSLVERFLRSDTTLTIEDFQLIYYGYQTTKVYFSKENEFNENLIKPLNRAAKYKEAIELADTILRINPVSIVAHFEKAFACAQLGLKELESFHFKRYVLLCNVIKLSGNGSGLLRYNCNSTNDALEFLAYKGLTALHDHKTETGLIQFDLAKNKQKLRHMYFYIPESAYTPPITDSE
jgi:hypothetical protein